MGDGGRTGEADPGKSEGTLNAVAVPRPELAVEPGCVLG